VKASPGVSWPSFSGSARADQRLFRLQVLHSDIDLLNPPAELERTKHKLKRLVQSPNSFFMDVKCTGCFSM
jgi:small subunit ribosomal protein S27e